MRIIIEGTEYPFPDEWTFREKRLVKHVTGLREGEMRDALMAKDPDVIVAFATVALFRAGEITTAREAEERLDNLTDDGITADFTDDEEEGGESPPDEAAESREPVPLHPKRPASSPSRTRRASGSR